MDDFSNGVAEKPVKNEVSKAITSGVLYLQIFVLQLARNSKDFVKVEEPRSINYYFGFRCWHPQWLQVLANAKVFTFCLCVASIIRGALVSGKQVVLNYAFIIICKRKCNVKENLVWYISGIVEHGNLCIPLQYSMVWSRSRPLNSPLVVAIYLCIAGITMEILRYQSTSF